MSDEALTKGPSEAIYDLGYRHYEGVRLGRAAIVRALFIDSLRGAYGFGRSNQAKIGPFILLALPLGVAAILTAQLAQTQIWSGSYREFTSQSSLFYVLFAASQAPVMVSRDLRSRLITLYFARPLRRTDYVSAKWAALTGALAGLMIAPLVLLYAGALLFGQAFVPHTRAFAFAVVGNIVLAATLSALALLAAAIAPQRGFGVAVIAVLLIALSIVGAIFNGLGEQLGRPALSRFVPVVNPFTALARTQDWLHNLFHHVAADNPAGLVALGVLLSYGALSAGLLYFRYARVSIA